MINFEKISDYFENYGVLVNTDGNIEGQYLKQHPVPFGEYIPFKNIFPYIKKFTQGREDFSSGKKIRSINLINNINIIPTICYESIFFENIITDKNINNDIIINITNDSWFGKFSGPYQHFYQARVRSPEFGKYQIRVSNNGISAVIDNYGKIINYIPLNKRAIKKRKDFRLYQKVYQSPKEKS